jgi:O-antigen/teichoic acid export membrane protein
MRFLDPYYYGIWVGLNIVLMYAAYAHLGIGYGVPIRLPYYQGKNNSEEVLKVADSGYFAWSLLTAACALGVLSYGIFSVKSSEFEKIGLIIIAGLIISEQQIVFLIRWQSSVLKDFKIYSILSSVRAFVTFCVLVPMTFFFNVKGLMVGTLLVSVLFAFIWWIKTAYRFKFKVSISSIIEMIKIGFPVMLVCLGGQLIETVDRILIISFLGPASLGCYAVTGLGGNALLGLVGQAGGAISPHMPEDFGKHNDSAPSLKKYLVKPTVLFAYIMTGLLMILAFVIPNIVGEFLPKYILGIKAFYCFLPGFFFLGIILTANNILNLVLIAQKRQLWLVYFQIVPIVVQVGLGIWFIQLGWDIAGVALASTISYALYGGVILWCASRLVLPDLKEHLLFMMDVIMPFIIGLGVSCLLIWIGQKIMLHHLILRISLQLFVGVSVMTILASYFNCKTGILTDVKGIFDAFLERFRRVS